MQRNAGQNDQSDEEAADDRKITNIVLLVAFLVIVGAGVWLVNAMIDARNLDDCVAQGRRNCVPIETPLRPRG